MTIADLAPTPSPVRFPRHRVPLIMQVTAAHFKVSVDDMIGPRRFLSFVLARQVAMYLAKDLTTQSLLSLSRRFNRDHSTVMSNIKRIRGQIAAGDETVLEAIAAIKAKVAETQS